MKATTRISKEERRREIIEAATHEFAISGLHGTPVDAIAKRVGVSQPYLFQLFGTKKDLFIAAVKRAFERMLDDRSLLLMQMQAYAACADEEIRDVVRDEMLRLVNFVQSASGAPEEAIREWLAYGMLMNVVAAMDLTEVDADWARLMCPVTGTMLASMAKDAVGKADRVEAQTKSKTRGGWSAPGRTRPFSGPRK